MHPCTTGLLSYVAPWTQHTEVFITEEYLLLQESAIKEETWAEFQFTVKGLHVQTKYV